MILSILLLLGAHLFLKYREYNKILVDKDGALLNQVNRANLFLYFYLDNCEKKLTADNWRSNLIIGPNYNNCEPYEKKFSKRIDINTFKDGRGNSLVLNFSKNRPYFYSIGSDEIDGSVDDLIPFYQKEHKDKARNFINFYFTTFFYFRVSPFGPYSLPEPKIIQY